MSATETAVTCYGLRDGAITITASGGVPSFSYSVFLFFLSFLEF